MGGGQRQSAKVARFSAAAFPARERYRRWVERDWPSLTPLLETKPADRLDFSAETTTVSLPGLTLTDARMSALGYRRAPERARRDGVDHLGVCVFLEGEARVDARGRGARLRPGSIWLGDYAQAYDWQSSDSRAISLSIPRAAAESVLPAVASMHGQALTPDQAAPFVQPFVSLWPHLAGESALNANAVPTTVLNLLSLSLGTPVADEAATDMATVRRLHAERLIRQRCGDPGFGPEALARAAGVSRATLYRLFEPQGGVAGAIRAARVERLRAALSDPRDTRQVAQLCFEAGFADPSVAARAFRAAHDRSPGDYRAASWAAALG